MDCKYLRSTGVVYDEFTIIKPDGSNPAPTGTESNNALISEPRVYPNPANDFLQVEFRLQSDAETLISLFDYNSRELFSEKIKSYSGENRKLFNISDLAPGNYIVNIKTEKETLSLPFVHK
jgi:hypothetical protein